MINISEHLNKLIEGNALPVLKSMPDKCADSIITSPPYYQLRKYEGIPDYIWDGNDECPHNFTTIETKLGNGSGGQSSRKQNSNTGSHFVDYSNRVIESSICSNCGAWKGQLGLEPSYQLYLSHLLQIISECKRVLKDEGTMWINLGDSYFGGGHGKWSKYDDGLISHKDKYYGNGRNKSPNTDWDYSQYPNKSLILIPHRFAISCIDDLGLILRNDLIWNKKNSMPESVLDRFSKKHEFIFFFVKHQKYYFDLDAIRDNPITKNILRNKGADSYGKHLGLSDKLRNTNNERGKNPGDVLEFWEDYTKMPLDEYLELCTEYYYNDENSSTLNITTKGNKDEHYATYSENLIKKLILSGTPKDGIILDPFAGTGTTIKSAIKFGRNGIGIEGSSKYVELANKELPMLRTMKENINKFI